MFHSFDPPPQAVFLEGLTELVSDARGDDEMSDRDLVLQLINFAVASAGLVGLTEDEIRLAVQHQIDADKQNAGRPGDVLAAMWAEDPDGGSEEDAASATAGG